MENDGQLTIRRLVFRGNILKKKAMHLPVLSLHAEQINRERLRRSRQKKNSEKLIEKKSISNFLHIIEEPEQSSRYMMTSMNNRSVFSKNQLFNSNRSMEMSSPKKRHISLPSEQCRGQLYHAIKVLLDKKKQHFKKSLEKSKEEGYNAQTKKLNSNPKRYCFNVDNSERLVGDRVKMFPSTSCRKVVPVNNLRDHIRKNIRQDRKQLVISTDNMLYSRRNKTERREQDLTGWNNPQAKDKMLSTHLVVENIEYQSLHF